MPYLRPDLGLLFKAKAVRAEDQDDFDRTVGELTDDERSQLARWIAELHGGEHPWVAALARRDGTHV